MNKSAKIFVAGHKGMVGSALVRKLNALGYQNMVTRSSKELDLLRQNDVEDFFSTEKPDYVFLAAAKVGGIYANTTYRADFIYENLMIQNNVIHAAYENQVKKLIFLGSSCIYPKLAPQPLKENYLLTGPLEESNEAYAIAKIAGIKLCEYYFHQYGCDFISLMPTNMYGLNDNYDLKTSHVIPALLRKIYLAKLLEENNWQAILADFRKNPMEGMEAVHSEEEIELFLRDFGIARKENKVSVQLWGNGEALREFLLVDDFAALCVELALKVEAKQLYSELKHSHINVGTGTDLSIRDLATLVKQTVGFSGEFTWQNDALNGTPQKCMDVSLMQSLTEHRSMNLEEGLKLTYDQYTSSE